MDTYYLISDENAQKLAELLTPEQSVQFRAMLHDTPAIPTSDVEIDMESADFALRFLNPLETLAKRANLLLFAVVAEPGASGTRLVALAPQRVRHLLPNSKRVLQNLLKDQAEKL